MGKAEIFTYFLCLGVEREGRGFRLVVNRKSGDVYLYFPGGQVGVSCLAIAFTNLSGGFDYALGFQLRKNFSQLGLVRIEDELRLSFAVAQVYEENAPVVAY